MEEKRKYERYRETVEVKVSWRENGTLVGKNFDFSNGGALVQVNFDLWPPVDTKMKLQLNPLVAGKEAPILKAKVVRTEPDGIAFEFIKDKLYMKEFISLRRSFSNCPGSVAM